MTTVTVSGEIDRDGNLHLEVPVGLPAGRAQVVVVVQPEGNAAGSRDPREGSARSGLFLGQKPNLDVDAALSEVNQAWKSKLLDLP